MKVTSIFILLFLAIFANQTSLFAQSFTIDSSKKTIDISGNFNKSEIQINAVEKQPEFPGGKKAWQDFLSSNINVAIPFSNKALVGNYKVMIRFIIGNDGKLRDVGADTNCGYGMESEVIRCIKKSVDWIPAETSSKQKVGFTMRTIVTFIVKQNDISVSFQ